MLSRSRSVALRGIRTAVVGLAPLSAVLPSAAPLLATPARSFAARRDPYEKVETVEADQDRISEFLTANGLGDHAGKFKSWEHMLMSESRTLKHHLQIPIKDRKKLRRASYVWRMTQYYTTGTPYVPQGPSGQPQPARRHALERLDSSSEEELATIVPMESTVGFIGTSRHYPGAHPRELYVEIPNDAIKTEVSAEDHAAISGTDVAAAQREVFMRGVLSDESGAEDADKAIASLSGRAAQEGGEDEAAAMKRALEKAEAEATAAAGEGNVLGEEVFGEEDGMTTAQRVRIATVGRAGIRV